MIEGLYYIQFGLETVLGTEVDATTKFRGKGFMKDDSKHTFPKEDVGLIGGAGRQYIPLRDATFDFNAIPATFEQLDYFLDSGIVYAAGVQDGAGTDYIRSHAFPYNAVPTIKYYTVEAGDEQQFNILTGCFTEELTISAKFGESWMMKPTMRGLPKDTTTATSAIAIPTVEEILFGNTKLYINAVSSAFGTTQKTGTLNAFELKISKVHQWKPITDGTGIYPVATKLNSDYKVELTLTLEHDSVAVAEDAARVAKTPRAIRLIATGGAIGTPGTTYSTKTAILDICGSYDKPMEYSPANANILTKHHLVSHYTAGTITNRGKILVVNELATLT